MTSLLRAGAVVAAFWAGIGSGTPAFAQQPERLPGTYITGQVLSANSDTPLRRVRIDVARGMWKAEPVLTDNDGRFSVDLERAGPATVTATKGGYLVAKTTVTQANLDRPLLMNLQRGAVITGAAFNEDGQPAVSTTVQAKRLDAAVEGFPAESATSTDDRGEYRLAGLAPGRYELTAGLNVLLSIPALGPAPPGIIVVVAAGDQISGVQLTVPLSRTLRGQMEALASRQAALPTPPRPAATLSAPGGLRGRVLTAARKPLSTVSVKLTGPGIGSSKTTDASGIFSFAGLRPGRYTLEAIVSDFGPWGYGQDGPSRASTPIVIADRIEEGIEIVLPQYVAIQGIVVDEHGEPVQGARVQALRVEYTSGRLVAVPAGTERRTDDQGSYRLWGLPGGTYLLSASVDGVFSDRRGGRVAYAPMYYPGTPNVAAASTIELREDSTLNLVFAPVGLTQITGKARESEGPLVGGTVRLAEGRRAGVVSSVARTAPIQGDGSFIIRNVPPGDYVLQVRGDGTGKTGLFATETVSVGSDPIDLLVRTSHGVSLEGRTVLEGIPERVPTCRPEPVSTAATFTAGCEFALTPVALDDLARGDATVMFGWNTNEVFTGQLSGRVSFALKGAPDDDWYLKAFTVNGVDIADSGLDFGTQPGRISDVEVVLSHNGASITGRRAEARGGAAGYFVLVFPTSYERVPPLSRRVKFTRSATDGSFRIAGLPAGDYLVAAVPRLQGGEWQNPELLRQLAPRAERVTLSEGQKATMSVRLLER